MTLSYSDIHSSCSGVSFEQGVCVTSSAWSVQTVSSETSELGVVIFFFYMYTYLHCGTGLSSDEVLLHVV